MEDIQEFFDSMPDEVTISVTMDKKVWAELYKRTQEEENGIVDERHVLNDWVLGSIRHKQTGVRFFYENADSGIPSVRFMDTRLRNLDPNKVEPRTKW